MDKAIQIIIARADIFLSEYGIRIVLGVFLLVTLLTLCGYLFDVDVMSMTILYLCDGKNENCGNRSCCVFNSESKYKYCMRTANEKHAAHGVCEGEPSWFPERFYRMKDGEDIWIEKSKY